MNKIFLILALVITTIIPKGVWAYEDDLDALLGKYVSAVEVNDIKYNGVDYDAWSKDSKHVKVRNALQKTDPDEFKTDEEKLAFWINAYNFFTVDLIIQKGERDSIKDLSGFLSPWKRYKWSVNGTEYTLDDIEHDIIRKLDEPRIHFAVNCAAKSCPDLRNEAYRAKKLDDQLSDQVKNTFSNATKGFATSKEENAVFVSKVMDWYDEDFNKGNLRSWLQPYFPLLINVQTKVKFFDYDWSLNSQSK